MLSPQQPIRERANLMMNRILLLLDRKPTLSEAAFTEMMLNTLRKDGSPYRIYKSNQTSVLLAVVGTQNFGDEQTVKRLAAQHFGPQWDFANDEYQEFKGPFGEQGACLVSWRSEAPDADDNESQPVNSPLHRSHPVKAWTFNCWRLPKTVILSN
jgi:hypothetical protein